MYKKIFLLLALTFQSFSTAANFSQTISYDPFKAVIGINEQQFFTTYGFSENGKLFLRKKLNDTQGTFYLHKVAPFASQPDRYPLPFTFSIIEGGEFPSGTSFQQYLDVAALQALPENNGAIFQVASNLDALEANGSKNIRIYQYIPIKTQGEICVLSAIPGIIDRMYLQPSVNLLKDFNWNGPVPHVEGYFPHYPGLHSHFKTMNQQDIAQAASTIYVGVQKDVVVTSGLRDYASSSLKGFSVFKAIPVKGSQQKITQVLTAALDPYNNRDLQHTKGFENFARTLLYGAYKGTFDVTYDLKAKKLFLTLVGGGVFENKFEWIAQAINAACEQFRHINTTPPLEVTLIVYHIPTHTKETQDWKTAEQIFKRLIRETKGTWKRYNKAGVVTVAL